MSLSKGPGERSLSLSKGPGERSLSLSKGLEEVGVLWVRQEGTPTTSWPFDELRERSLAYRDQRA